MIVVLDTNVWISELALSSTVGSAVRFYLRENNARIGLPEVIKLETEHHLRTNLNKYIEDINRSHRQLLAAFGRLKEIVLPGKEEVEELIFSVFSRLGLQVEEIPFTLESAKNSLIRTVESLPPSDRNQQFKDGVIWADCLKLLESESVFLVTNDKAFYKKREFVNGLADELKEELNGISHEFKIFPSLKELLSAIRIVPEISPKQLVQAYMQAHRDHVEDMASKNSFMLSDKFSTELDVFATEEPQRLFVDYTIVFDCIDITNQARVGGEIIVRGEGTWETNTKELIDMKRRGEKLIFRLEDGTEKKLENYVLLAGNIVLGHREVEHSVRYRL